MLNYLKILTEIKPVAYEERKENVEQVPRKQKRVKDKDASFHRSYLTYCEAILSELEVIQVFIFLGQNFNSMTYEDGILLMAYTQQQKTCTKTYINY